MLDKLAPVAAANARSRPTSCRPPPGTRSPPGTGPSTPNGCAASGSPSTPQRCVPTSSSSACCTTASSAPPSGSTGCASPSATTCRSTTPTCASSTSFDEDGPLGLFVADFYARDSKRGGAWMNSFVDPVPPARAPGRWCSTPSTSRSRRRRADAADAGQRPHPVPRVRPRAARPVLRRAVPDVRRARRVPRDFVEYPSQVNEMWLDDPEILAGYARHHETGEPIPAELVAKLARPAASARASRPPSTWPRPCSTRRGTGSRADAGGRRRRGVRGRRAARRASTVPERAAALPHHLLQPRLRRRLQRRLLLLHLERGARRRHRRVVQRARRAAPRERRALPPRAALPRRRRRPDGGLPRRSAAATRTSPRCWFGAVFRADGTRARRDLGGGLGLHRRSGLGRDRGLGRRPPRARLEEPQQLDRERQHQGRVLLRRHLHHGLQQPQLQRGRVRATSPRRPGPASPRPAARRRR